MSNNLVSMDNLLNILKGVKSGVVSKINARDVTAAQKTTLSKADSIITTGDGTSFLADNGTYKAVDVASINDIHTKTQTVMNLFNISYTNDTLDTSVTITMPNIRDYFNSQIYNGKIYIIGGSNGSTILNTVDIYDINSNTWSTGANMTTAVKFFTSQVYNGKIYCIGGFTTAASNLVQIYDINSNTWSTGANMTTAIYKQTSQVYNGKIYCIGGFTTATSNLVQIYDINSNTWSTGANMTTARFNLTSQIYNDKLYCIGGFDGSTTYYNLVQIYNITNNTWSAGSNMPTTRSSLTSQIYDNLIYCIGGMNGTTYYNIIEIYNTIADSWITDIISLPISKAGLSSVKYNGKIYCIGGYNPTSTTSIHIISLGTTNFTLNLPTDLQTKLNLIPDTPGDGTLVLADNGTYIPVPLGYRFMTDTEVSSQVSTIIAYTG